MGIPKFARYFSTGAHVSLYFEYQVSEWVWSKTVVILLLTYWSQILSYQADTEGGLEEFTVNVITNLAAARRMAGHIFFGTCPVEISPHIPV